MSVEKDNKFEKAWDRAVLALGKHGEEIKRISKVGKLKIDHTRLQKDLNAIYKDLGVQAYRLLKESRFDPAELADLVAKIDEAVKQTETKKKEIESISGQSQITRVGKSN